MVVSVILHFAILKKNINIFSPGVPILRPSFLPNITIITHAGRRFGPLPGTAARTSPASWQFSPTPTLRELQCSCVSPRPVWSEIFHPESCGSNSDIFLFSVPSKKMTIFLFRPAFCTYLLHCVGIAILRSEKLSASASHILYGGTSQHFPKNRRWQVLVLS